MSSLLAELSLKTIRDNSVDARLAFEVLGFDQHMTIMPIASGSRAESWQLGYSGENRDR